ncbi:protein kinase [Oculatella sp. LEGE 06141]|uniref:serine/threonine protein kinase n=1 Tax=Oculatella sp. LEGE 06141 TaxID=1828648 RepID=UPI00187F13CB|nr:serine/threonine protein kinase [Oculatella sp. LEGE 06141]MBE9180638.1 protein kinase [Oculatella sp. LEGE 06141]
MNSPSVSDPWLGRRLGDQQRYRLDRRLGSGAVGDVFLAMDVRLGRRVAIKVLKGALAKSKELLARFEREVALSVALESEHIVQVIDYGVATGGFPFYVMEYLQGQTLSQLLSRTGRLSIERTVTIANQLCAGLKVAHEGVTLWKEEATVSEQVKVIHRDLKPANIFVVNTALGELVKILDFGIAKKLHTTGQAEQTNLTQAFLGTFRYAAPEQLKNAWNIDERADIYSLGMILYQMLSGTEPFGIEAKTSSQLEMSWAMAHASVEPTPLRQQPYCQSLPPELEAVVMRCLCKRSIDRFASVVELGQALKAIVQVTRVASVTAFSRAAQAEALDPTVSQPLVQRQDATIHRPLAQLSSPTAEPSLTTQAPSHLEPERPDATIVQGSGNQPRPDQTIVQSTTAPSPAVPPGVPDATVAQTPPGTTDGTIVQSPPLQPPKPPNTTILQSPPTPGSPPAGATIVQNPAYRKPGNADATIAQTPPQSIAPRPDATIVQPFKSTPYRDMNQVDEPLAQVPPLQGREVAGAQQHQAGVQGNAPVRNGSLVSQGVRWLKSSYGDRLIAQASADVRQTSRRLSSGILVPLGVGFAVGLTVMAGAYFFLRAQFRQHLPRQNQSLLIMHSTVQDRLSFHDDGHKLD